MVWAVIPLLDMRNRRFGLAEKNEGWAELEISARIVAVEGDRRLEHHLRLDQPALAATHHGHRVTVGSCKDIEGAGCFCSEKTAIAPPHDYLRARHRRFPKRHGTR
jgi:hypothetical protein